MSILLTGGTGFIGSHTAVELINSGFDVVLVDNLANSSKEVVNRIEKITGKKPKFYEIDVTDYEAVSQIFEENQIDGVIHFAAFKSVPESIKNPINYYRNNLDSAITILEVMKKYNCNNFVFSSSATVYGSKNPVPFKEDMPVGDATNPYGTTKIMIERIVQDYAIASSKFSGVILRYFNPIGAHPSGLIGEDPQGIPGNLMPYVTQVAVGRREFLNVYGNDYNTSDGTGVRDYIHVVDLAKGHVVAIKYATEHVGTEVFNLGTGKGKSVLEVVKSFEEATGIKIPIKFCDRRPGDIASFYASVEKAEKILKWHAEYSLQDMCKNAWNWQKNNPKGYNS